MADVPLTAADRPSGGPAEGPVDRPVRFLTIADASYFPGLAALVNSLRLQGHAEPVTVLDLGLEPWQRALLDAECELVQLPEDLLRHPWFLHPFARFVAAEGTIVYVDSDIIVTEPLDAILAAARDGRICVFPDPLSSRWFAEWQEVFGVAGPPRRQTYVNAGFIAFSTDHFPRLLDRWWECCDRIKDEPTLFDPDTGLESPHALASQDALNALLMAEVRADQLAIQPEWAGRQGPGLAGARLVDPRTLECRAGDRRVALLHALGPNKPWHEGGRRFLRHNAYVESLRRLLVVRDVAVRVPGDRLPVWLRPGVVGFAVLRFWTARNRAVQSVHDRRAALRARAVARRGTPVDAGAPR